MVIFLFLERSELPIGTKFLLIGLCLHGLRPHNLLHARGGVSILLPYSAKAKPFVNIPSGFSLLVSGEACFCGIFFFEGVYLQSADSLCLHRLSFSLTQKLTPVATLVALIFSLANANLQRQSRRLLLLP